MEGVVPDVLPAKPVAFLRAKPAIKQYGRHVPQQVRVFGLDRLFTARCCTDALKRTLIGFQNAIANLLSGFQVCSFFASPDVRLVSCRCDFLNRVPGRGVNVAEVYLISITP
jgi:hypothetical protein